MRSDTCELQVPTESHHTTHQPIHSNQHEHCRRVTRTSYCLFKTVLDKELESGESITTLNCGRSFGPTTFTNFAEVNIALEYDLEVMKNTCSPPCKSDSLRRSPVKNTQQEAVALRMALWSFSCWASTCTMHGMACNCHSPIVLQTFNRLVDTGDWKDHIFKISKVLLHTLHIIFKI